MSLLQFSPFANKMKRYKCGKCGYLSKKIPDLHDHLVNHDESIGYFFHFDSRTAFPKDQCYVERRDTQTQTLPEEETVSEVLQNVEQFEIKTEINDKNVCEFIEEEFQNEDKNVQTENEVLSLDNLYNEVHLEIIKQDPFEANSAGTESNHSSTLQNSPISPSFSSVTVVKPRNRNGRFMSKKKQQGKQNLFKKRNTNIESKKTSNTKSQPSVNDDISLSIDPSPATSYTMAENENPTTIHDRKKISKSIINYFFTMTRTENGEGVYECMHCTFTCLSDPEMKLHIFSNHQTSSMCTSCEKSFDDESELWFHMKTCKKYTCTKCTYSCTTKYKLRLHKQLMHTKKSAAKPKEKSPRPALCDFCGKVIGNHQALGHHRSICNKRHECNICGFKCPTPGTLKEHLLLHSGEKPHICEQCGKPFRKKQCLVDHQKRLHSGKRPYGCNFCEKSFSVSPALAKHMKVHTKIKNHHCNFCEKSFSCRWNLKGHMRQHNGEKPYSCTKCGEKFKHNVSRKTHEAKCSFLYP